MGWERGGKFKREGIYVQLWVAHIVVRQKPAQHCKAIFLQIKKKTTQQTFGYDLNLIFLSDNMENGLVMGKTDLGELIKRILDE